MSAAKAGTAMTSNRINFINKYYTGCIFFALGKHVTNTGGTNSDKHLNEIGSGNTEKRNIGFSCYCLCKQRFTCTRSPYKQNTGGNTTSKCGKFTGIFQKVDYLFEFCFSFINSRNIGKGDLVVALLYELGPVFAK